jgi:hypothetical protein
MDPEARDRAERLARRDAERRRRRVGGVGTADEVSNEGFRNPSADGFRNPTTPANANQIHCDYPSRPSHSGGVSGVTGVTSGVIDTAADSSGSGGLGAAAGRSTGTLDQNGGRPPQKESQR